MGAFGANFGSGFQTTYSPIIDENSSDLLKETLKELSNNEDFSDKINSEWDKYQEPFLELFQTLYDKLETLPNETVSFAIRLLELLQHIFT